MPVHWIPQSRRSFLAQGAAAIAGLTVARTSWGDSREVDPHRFVLLSDTHIPESPDVIARGVNMTANLRHVVRDVTQLDRKPAGVFINGDCAYQKGLPADYANLASCVEPLATAGLPLHVTMGNHDDRQPLYEAFRQQKPAQSVVASKHVSVVEAPRANWFLLDSLAQVNMTPGELGEAQRTWLAEALSARADKPALVMVHHNPQFDPPAEGKSWFGIKDTAALIDLLERHKHVKALIFGHTHVWSIARRGTLHLVNLPPVAYVFAEGKPNGWVTADLLADRIVLQLKTLDPAHGQNGERVELAWAG